MPRVSYSQIASSYFLWLLAVNPHVTTSKEEFDAMSHAARVAQIVETFGPEPDRIPTVDKVLDDSAIGGGFHRWAVIGGSIMLSTDQLRPLLEEAYDPNMPDWVALVDVEA
jgi:hypothetical protein